MGIDSERLRSIKTFNNKLVWILNELLNSGKFLDSGLLKTASFHLTNFFRLLIEKKNLTEKKSLKTIYILAT